MPGGPALGAEREQSPVDGGTPLRAFVRSRHGLEAPDLLLGLGADVHRGRPARPIARQSGVSCYAHPMRPESKGTIHIVSAGRRAPEIRYNFLSAPVDGRKN